MSQAVRELAVAPEPVVRPERRSAPAPRHAPPRGTPRPRARRRHHVGFLILSAIVVGSMVLGLAALNTLIAQTSFRADDLEARIDVLARRHLGLTSEHARMSAPGRIATWARRNGMRLPDDIRFLHAHDGSDAMPAGEADRPDRTR